MPSSKFNRTPVPRLRPPICKAPFGSCIPGYPWNDPPFLQGSLEWHDDDPLFPTFASGYVFLAKIGPGRTYFGISPGNYPAVGAHVAVGAGPDQWDISISYHDPPIGPFTHTWSNIWVDPLRPFDSERLTFVTIPGQDYRVAHIIN